jgi:hypothetical protein
MTSPRRQALLNAYFNRVKPVAHAINQGLPDFVHIGYPSQQPDANLKDGRIMDTKVSQPVNVKPATEADKRFKGGHGRQVLTQPQFYKLCEYIKAKVEDGTHTTYTMLAENISKDPELGFRVSDHSVKQALETVGKHINSPHAKPVRVREGYLLVLAEAIQVLAVRANCGLAEEFHSMLKDLRS